MPGLIRLGDGVGLAAANRTTISTSYDIYDENGNLVGYLTSLTRNDSRQVQRIRHFSSMDAGRTVEQDPGPEEITADLGGFALYNDANHDGQFPHFSLAARISKGTDTPAVGGDYLFKSINSQHVPFTIRMEETHPSTQVRSITYFFNCMLTRYSKPVNLGTITVAETCSIQVGQVDIPAASNVGGSVGIIVGALVS